MKTVEIRELFLKYFEEKQHKVTPSAPLVPINDPSLLWISAGVVPMKKFFDGSEVPENKRMVSSQKCLRTNDIENVGYTARHHTYFEMLGNFSIGDYFKNEAIPFALEFLTSKQWLGLDLDKLYMTYYPNDTESRDIWLNHGIDASHLVPLDGNFWEIGEGPCGPCTEIFYDRGEKYDERGVEILFADLENDRYIEIWNVVLSQFNSKEELERNDYPELPSKNIDTGMGLERVACIMQDVDTNFDTDLFAGIISALEKMSNIKYSGQVEFKVIADHVRTMCLAINDSALPSNEGRGYVLRRILRRAVKYGVKLGFNEPFMYKLVDEVVISLPFYDFSDNLEMIKKIIKGEEEKFYKTLTSGEKKLEEFIKKGSISGEESFLLYDTFGFPIELTIELASEAGINVDINEFNSYLEIQKDRSRSSRNENSGLLNQSETLLNLNVESNFIGYNSLECDANIVAIIKDDELVNSAVGNIGLILDETVFYAESGGQISDVGQINDMEVINVIKAPHGQHIHFVDAKNEVVLGSCKCKVDANFRNDVTKNHSVTHLLNFALKKHFGNHIKQQGSYVCDKYLRFDFTHFETVTDDDIVTVENFVNEYIKTWNEVLIEEMNIDDAKKKGAAALFGEKYGNTVRVVKLGDSLELCGGCHVDKINTIQQFAVASFESKGSGVYRILAATSNHIKPLLEDSFDSLIKGNDELFDKINVASQSLSSISDNHFDTTLFDSYVDKYNNLKRDLNSYSNRVMLNEIKNVFSKYKKDLDKAVKELESNVDSSSFDIESTIIETNDLKISIFKADGLSVDAAKGLVDNAFEQYNLDLVFVAAVTDKVVFLSKASDKAVASGVKCGNLVKEAAIICEGNGGGRPNFAQAGGKNSAKVDEAIDKVKDLI